jgi:hypothetical protein
VQTLLAHQARDAPMTHGIFFGAQPVHQPGASVSASAVRMKGTQRRAQGEFGIRFGMGLAPSRVVEAGN